MHYMLSLDYDDDLDEEAPHFDPEMLARLSSLSPEQREAFGKIVLALLASARYRHDTILELQRYALEPLLHGRVVFLGQEATAESAFPVLAFWASVSDEVENTIREQARAGVFPVRLRPQDWDSGANVWVLDVLASTRPESASLVEAVAAQATASVPGWDRAMQFYSGMRVAYLEKVLPKTSHVRPKKMPEPWYWYWRRDRTSGRPRLTYLFDSVPTQNQSDNIVGKNPYKIVRIELRERPRSNYTRNAVLYRSYPTHARAVDDNVYQLSKEEYKDILFDFPCESQCGLDSYTKDLLATFNGPDWRVIEPKRPYYAAISAMPDDPAMGFIRLFVVKDDDPIAPD